MQNIAQILGRLSLPLLVCISLLIATPVKAKHHVGYSDYEDRAAEHRIAGGYPIGEDDHPSFVSILATKYFGSVSNLCSGVALSEDLVLTAAHCFVDFVDTDILAAPGIWAPNMWLSRGVKPYRVSKSCRSRRYDFDMPPRYDFQVLRLARPMKGIKPAFLPAMAVPNGFRALVVGVGLIDRRTGRFAERAQALPIEKVICPPEAGRETVACFQSYSPKWVGDSCPGDSGGPVYAKTAENEDVVIATTSFGTALCQKGVQAISGYGDIFAAIEEIEELVARCSSLGDDKKNFSIIVAKSPSDH